MRLNLGSLPRTQGLTPRQLWGTALAVAQASRHGATLRAVDAAAAEHLDETERTAARTAAALMAMNNVYYRFVHLCSRGDYAGMPARLRMQALARPGVEKADFELFCLAVSAVNGCGMCIDAHEKALVDAGHVGPETVQAAVRVAAVIHGVAATLEAEDALAQGREAGQAA
ncbi:MAG: carboxymuconolactone decarboxylase family protein [Myxococcota bacterium]|nr:carboxymuconolactone decarboxylase family protein [Myxococcota bacterium]